MSSLNHLNQQNKPEWKSLLNQLDYLFNNLATVEKQLSNISNPDAEKLEEDVLDDTNPHTLTAMWHKIKANLNTDSMLFRHAIRMAITLTLGYGIIQGFDIERGYWILLTTLFVCQPNYSATRQKLTARVIWHRRRLVDWRTTTDLLPVSREPVSFHCDQWRDVLCIQNQ